MELKQIVESLISKGYEGSYWDFKQKWHDNNADLLKDIICMANNTTPDMQDGYIIFGIEDKTFNIIGVSEDANRKSQENIIGFLSSKSWSGEESPDVEIKSIKISNTEIDMLIIRNNSVTPYYLLNDYCKTDSSGKNKIIVRAGVIYSRVGDRNTSSAECATKQSAEFLWKKRFGLVGSDEFKIIKRLQNIDNWYSIQDFGFDTIYNREYNDIRIERDLQYELAVDINDGRSETVTWVMDFPYLFTSVLNWNIGQHETGRRAKWDIILNDRKLEVSLYGVQGTRQDHYHIEPDMKFDGELGIKYDEYNNSIQYYFYYENNINYLAYKLFFEKQCYHDDQKALNKAFTVIPIFENEKEHNEFLDYVKKHKEDFKNAVDTQDINEMFPLYAKNVKTVIVYKLGKTLVQWLEKWRFNRGERR